MTGKHIGQFDLNADVFESDGNQQMIGDTPNQTTENVGQDVNVFNAPRPRRRRHTQQQIQILEEFFDVCQYPDRKQRKTLSLWLQLTPRQVKCWFQNKRMQIKARLYDLENLQLQAEHERLKADNLRYKEQLKNSACQSCGGPLSMTEKRIEAEQLLLVNAYLRKTINLLSASVGECPGKVFEHCGNSSPSAP